MHEAWEYVACNSWRNFIKSKKKKKKQEICLYKATRYALFIFQSEETGKKHKSHIYFFIAYDFFEESFIIFSQ